MSSKGIPCGFDMPVKQAYNWFETELISLQDTEYLPFSKGTARHGKVTTQ